MARVCLVDGTNLLYRAYHALQSFSTSGGVPTHAVFGFLNMIFKLLKDEKPDLLAVVFDPPGPTLKHGLYEDYKANREKPPDDFIIQIPYVHRALNALGIPEITIPGIEADDVLGTLAARRAAQGDRVVIVTGDKDFCQLVSPAITLLDTMRGTRTGPAEVVEKMGAPPEKVVDLLALAGDAVDNLPGVPGIGLKTAAKLVGEYGSLEGVVQNAGKIGGKKGEAIALHGERALGNRALVTIETGLDLPPGIFVLDRRPMDRKAAQNLFKELQFRKFITDLGLVDEPAPATLFSAEPERAAQEKPSLPPDRTGLWLQDGEFAAVDAGGKASRPGRGAKIPHGLKIAGYRFKEYARRWDEIGLAAGMIDFDVELAAYLLNPGRRVYEPGDLLADRGIEAASGPEGMAAGLMKLAADMEGELAEKELLQVFREIEMPLVPILAGMEMAGVKVDLERLGALSEEYSGRIADLETRLFAMAGEEFNPRSTKDLSRILFEKLNLPVLRKTATGASTDASVLEELSLMHDLPALVIEHRGLTKLKNSFIDTLPELVDPADGRIHTSFQQAVTATGRLSSTNPNLQNIPVRGEEGRRIRSAFVAEPGHVLVSADYSQIEFRVLAHMCGDKALLDMFATGRDIHSETACRLFDTGPLGITSDMRRQAKIVNFGILYGMSPFGLARRLGVNLAAAKKMIDTYFKRFPGVGAFINRLIADAAGTGVAKTLYGRIRPIPDLTSRNRNLREAAERLAVNTPIQGTAADIVKIAMIKADRALKASGVRGRMILQVHDELVLEVPGPDVQKASEVLKTAMEGAADLLVPLKVETGSASDWYLAH